MQMRAWGPPCPPATPPPPGRPYKTRGKVSLRKLSCSESYFFNAAAGAGAAGLAPCPCHGC